MATKITEQDIIDINELYVKMGTYAAVARELGFSAGTVKKYVIADYQPRANLKHTQFDEKLLDNIDDFNFDNVEDFGDLCILDNGEVEEIKELWDELLI